MQTQAGEPAEILWCKGNAAIVHLKGLQSYARERDMVLSKKFGALLKQFLPSIYHNLGLVCNEETAVSVVESFERLILCGEVTPTFEKLLSALRAVLLVKVYEPEDKLELAASLATEQIFEAVFEKEPHYVGWFLGEATRVPAVPPTQPVTLPPATWRCTKGDFKRLQEVTRIVSVGLQEFSGGDVRSSTVKILMKHIWMAGLADPDLLFKDQHCYLFSRASSSMGGRSTFLPESDKGELRNILDVVMGLAF